MIFELIARQSTKTSKSYTQDSSLKTSPVDKNVINITQSTIRRDLQSHSDSYLTQPKPKANDIHISRQSSFSKTVRKNGINRLTKEDMDFLFNDSNNNSYNGDVKGSQQQCPVIYHSSQSSISSDGSEGGCAHALHLKGEMKFISTWKKVLFVCSPV